MALLEREPLQDVDEQFTDSGDETVRLRTDHHTTDHEIGEYDGIVTLWR